MVSREYPEGVSAVITGREWTAASCQLLQDHPELLVTEVDLEEDRDREDYLSVIKVQKAKEEAVNTTEVVLPATLPPVADQPSSVLMSEKSSLNGDGMEGDMAAGDDVNQLKLKVNLREKKQIEEEKEEEQQINGEDNDEEEGEGGEEEGGDEEEEEEETVIAMDVDEAHSGAIVSDVTRATYVSTDVTAESGQGNMSVTEPSQIHAETSMNICPPQMSIRDQAVLPSTVHSGGVSCDANERSGEGALVGVSLSAGVGVGVGAVDDIEAMKRAFEDASDSDDDEEDDDEGEGEGEATGGGGGEERNNDKNGEDEEDDDDDDDDGEEMILEEGVGSQTVGGHEVVLEVELQTANVEQEQAGEDEQGEDASNDEEEEGDEEDWMKDV